MSGPESSAAHGRAEHKTPRIFAPHDPAASPRACAGPDEGRSRLRGRPAPGWLAVRLVSIPAHSEMADEPSEWAGAVVVVEAGEIELEC